MHQAWKWVAHRDQPLIVSLSSANPPTSSSLTGHIETNWHMYTDHANHRLIG